MEKMEVEKLSENGILELKKMHAQLDDLQRNNRTLHEQVDILQIESKEQKRTWFKNPSILVSLLAVSVTVILTTYNMYEQGIKDKQSNIRAAISALVEAQKENIKLPQITNANERDQLDILINSQRQVLIEDAKVMADELGVDASANSLLFLGWELQKDSEFESALTYYERALESAGDNILDQVTALKSLANYRMMPNTGFDDYEQGQKYWQQALDVQKGQQDDYSIFVKGNTYLSWGYAEYRLGNKNKATKKLAQSESTFKLMDVRNPLRGQALKRYGRALKSIIEIKTPLSATQLTGDWELKYLENNNVTGSIQIRVNPTNLALYVIGELIDMNGIIVQRFNGQLLFTGPETLIINWQGAKTGARGIEQLQGGITLTILGNNALKGTESILGRRIAKVEFERI